MKSFLKTAGLAGILAAGFATFAAEPNAAQLDTTLREGQGVTTALSANTSAITHWVNEADGWHVVTTVDTVTGQDGDSDTHAIVRFSSVLLPGESQTVSVPFPIGEPQQALRIRRLGDQLKIERVQSAG